VRFIVPAGVDDPERVSGGNVYDRRVRDGLHAAGWRVAVTEVADGEAVRVALGEHAGENAGEHGDVRRGDAPVLVDGLVAAWEPAAIERAAETGRVVVLAHMLTEAFADADPRAVDRERRALAGATRVIATSKWTASELVGRGIVGLERVTVALPGAAESAEGDEPTTPGAAGRLLCVGTVAPHKGQDILLDALSRLGSLDWTCTVVGSRDADPSYAGKVADAAARLGPRVRMTGVLGEDRLRAAYRASGLLVAPSRVESFGMAIADARGHGLPVIASRVGGIPESVAGGGAVLVRADDPAALASVLEQWMTDPALRARLRAEAAGARASAPRWALTVDAVARVLGAA
jgi:hypothetical protein